MKRLQGKVAIITGSSSGIGRATALLFAKEGASLVLTTSRNKDGLHQVAEEARDLGADVLPLLADASSEKDWDMVVTETIQKFGKINLLVNNAGRRPFGGVETATMKDLSDAFKYDVFSVFLGMNRCVPYMKKARENNEEASIVNISSLSEKAGSPEYLCYISAKAAVSAMTKCAAADLCGTGIRINSVLPGLIDTPLIHQRPKEDLQGFIDQFMIRRAGRPEEIAQGILFLCSDESCYIDATELIIDGGFTGTRSLK